jgi:hypothetical protein
MAVTSRLYGNAPLLALSKKIDWLNDTIKVQLHTSAYTPDQDVHDFQNDLTGEVAAGGGYATGGVTLTGKTLTYTGATNIVAASASDAVWASSTITARTAVVIDTTPGTTATNPLIAYHQSDVDISSAGGEYRVAWAAAGIVQITVT